jgi:hypothetical protein
VCPRAVPHNPSSLQASTARNTLDVLPSAAGPRDSSAAGNCPPARQNPSRPRPFGLPSASAAHPGP